ncbi:PUA-like domain-containing protein [Cladochytrium replicatum]|nr:PUA-like domain-containing protein [Cladochytrium replicatum]
MATVIATALRCSACSELLNCPITLPCGNSVCRSCLPFPPFPEPSFVRYSCPVTSCSRRHYARGECVDISIRNLIEKCYPVEFSALSLVQRAAVVLPEEAFALLGRAEAISPQLQAIYLVRAAVWKKDGKFESAIRDASRAAAVNEKNGMGQRLRDRILEDAPEPLKPLLETMEWSDADEIQSLRELANIPSAEPHVFPTVSDFECNMCYYCFMDPVGLPCGHTWCRRCLSMAHDAKKCPLCRTALPSYKWIQNRPSHRAITAMMTSGPLDLREAYAGRIAGTNPQPSTAPNATADDIPANESLETIPIFVCSLVLPGTNTSFHIFEPRYRVMVDRCMQGSRRIGIAPPRRGPPGHDYPEYGTVCTVEVAAPIHDASEDEADTYGLPRYYIAVKGSYRFKAIERGVSEEGYCWAKIERVDDDDPEDDEDDEEHDDDNEDSIGAMSARVRKFVGELVSRLPYENTPTPPTDPGDLTFWAARFIPSNDGTKYQLMQSTSVAKRLRTVCGWIDSMETSAFRQWLAHFSARFA